MWLFLTFIVAAALLGVAFWLKSKAVRVKWNEWVIGAIGLLLLAFALQNYFASVKELEPIAPGMFLLTFGIPALCLMIIALALPLWRYFKLLKKGSADKLASE